MEGEATVSPSATAADDDTVSSDAVSGGPRDDLWDDAENTDELDLDDERRTPDVSAAAWEISNANEHDLALARVAIEDRVDRLKKLEKSNTDEGYLKAAREVRADIDRLQIAILPAMTLDQSELPLLTATEARLGIANHLHDVIRRYVRDSDGPEDNPTEDFENEVCQRVERFARRSVERAYAAGQADRAAHPASFMLGALDELDHQELKDQVGSGG